MASSTHRPGQAPGNWLTIPAFLLAATMGLPLAGCGAGPQPPLPAIQPSHSAPPAAPCEYPDKNHTPTFPNGKPIATALSPNLIRLRSWISSDDGDMLHANAAILDAVGVTPTPAGDQALALLSFTVTITTPDTWESPNSLMLIPYQRANGTLTPTQPICADQDQNVLDAMRATGHPPLPPQVEPGQTATGWAAFRIPQDSSALTLLMLRRGHNGYMASESALLKK
jgi:hypothetical protein